MEAPRVSSESPYKVVAWITRAVAAIVVFALCAGVAGWLNATAPRPGEVKSVAALQQVKVFQARAVPMRRQWRGYGVAAALDRADVPARVTATVARIPASIQAGRPVKAGDTLIELDGTDFLRQVELAQQRIAELEAQLKQIDVEAARYQERRKIEAEDIRLAENEVRRIAALVKDSAAKQFELEAAQRTSLSAQRAELATRELLEKIEPRKSAWQALRDGQESSLKIAQQNLDRCNVTSPITGVLQTVDVKLGESLQAGQRVARVVSLARVEMPVQLPVAARTDIVIGGRVELNAANNTSQCWDAKVVRLSPEDDATTRTMTAFVEVDQQELAAQFGAAGAGRLLTPGQFVGATVWSEVIEPRWIVPRRSIRAGRVLVARNGIVVSLPVTIDYLSEGAVPQLGVPDDQWAVLVTEGMPLKEGDLVVLNASTAVRDGDKIDPQFAPPDATIAQPSDATRTTAEKDAGKSATP
jgi:multidrug efflux pump subunit AcrA (membrane-fusion protein)